MNIQPRNCYIGIDISKANLDVFISSSQNYFTFPNTSAGFKKLILKIETLPNVFVVMEATGGYEKKLSQALAFKNIPTSIVNPRLIRHFAKAIGRLAKTDRIDAKVITLYGEKIQPTANVKQGENHLKLAELQVRRKQFIEMIIMEKNRLDKVSQVIKKSIDQVIHFLQKKLEKINSQLQKIIEQDEEYLRRNNLLKTIKGVGKATIATLLSDLPELGTLSGKQIAALAGVAPYNCDSGTLRGKRMIWGGRASVRNGLYMATLVATKHNSKIRAFYQRLCAAGKLKQVALIACMRKLLIIMNAMIKNNQSWQSEP